MYFLHARWKLPCCLASLAILFSITSLSFASAPCPGVMALLVSPARDLPFWERSRQACEKGTQVSSRRRTYNPYGSAMQQQKQNQLLPNVSMVSIIRMMGERKASQLVCGLCCLLCWLGLCCTHVLAGPGREAAAGHKCMPRCARDVDEDLYLKNIMASAIACSAQGPPQSKLARLLGCPNCGQDMPSCL